MHVQLRIYLPGFNEVKFKIEYLESCDNCNIWSNRYGFLISGMSPDMDTDHKKNREKVLYMFIIS